MKKRALAIALSLALLLSVFVPGTLATSSTETETDTTTVVSQSDTEVLAEDGEGTQSGDEQTDLTDGETVTGDGQTTDEDSVTGDSQTAEPTETTGASEGSEPTETTAATDPTGTTAATDPTETTAATDPTETTAATDPTETTAATDPTETTAATDPTETTAATDPTETTGPVCTCPGTDEEKAAEGFVHKEGCPYYVEQEPETIVDRTIETSVDGLTFAVKGSLPESAELSVSALGSTAGEFIRSDVLNLDELPDGYTGSAFDIKILDKETGAEIEPAAPVTVTVYGTDTTEESDVQVYHLPDTDAEDVNAMMSMQTMRAAASMFALAPAETTSGSGEEIASVYAGDAYITFTADNFSVYYIVTGTKDDDYYPSDLTELVVMPGSVFTRSGRWTRQGTLPNGVRVEYDRREDITTVSISANAAAAQSFTLKSEQYVGSWPFGHYETVTLQVTIKSREDVVLGAINSAVYLPVKMDVSKGLPSEPGNTEGKYIHMTSRYGTSDNTETNFSTTGVGIISPDIVNSPNFVPSVDGSSTFGVVDSTGVETKKVLVDGSIDWDSVLDAMANRRDIVANDGETLTPQNKDKYEVIPYVVKYKAQSFKWHIDCAVVLKDTVTLQYAHNLDSEKYYISGTMPTLPSSSSGYTPHTATVGSIVGLGEGGTIQVQDRTSGDAPMTLTFKEWNTEPDGSGVSYDPGDQITITENTTLYAIWEGELIPGTLQISKTVAADKDVEVPDETFTFRLDLTKAGAALGGNYSYVIKNQDESQASTGTISSGGTLALKADQTAVISELPHNASYTVTEVNIPLGFTSNQTNDSVAGTVLGGQTSSVAFTNTYVPPVADLTITKTGCQPVDENQTFVFQVVGEGVSMEVAICGNGKVVIKDLPLGEYMITETGWSWRYQPENSAQTVVLDEDHSVTFSNSRVKNQWLNGSAYDNNSFAGIESN